MLLYVADPSPEFLLAAEIAGADGVIDKAADTRELLRAVRGERVLPAVGLRERARAAARLDPRDRPIFAMRLAGTIAAGDRERRRDERRRAQRPRAGDRRAARARRALQRSPERQRAPSSPSPTAANPAASYMRRAGALSGKTPTSSASKPCAAAQPAHASQSARAAPWPRASGATHIAFSTAVAGVVARRAPAQPAVLVVDDDERALLLARLRERRPRVHHSSAQAPPRARRCC